MQPLTDTTKTQPAGSRRKRAPIAEADLQRLVTDWLDLAGICYSETDAARVWDREGRVRRSRVAKGWPDITACEPGSGRLVAIELKRHDGRLRPEQVETLARLERDGALVIVARTLEDVVEPLVRRCWSKAIERAARGVLGDRRYQEVRP